MHDFHDHFLTGDVEGTVARLAPGAVFHSPIADYADAEQIATVHGALSRVMDEARVVSVLRADRETAVAFRARAAGRDLDGMLRVVEDGTGQATDVTLLLRPLDALLAGVERMKEELAA